MTNFLKMAATALVLGASLAMPRGMGQRYTPEPRRVVLYDGDGKKVKPKVHPHHNARDGYERRKFAEKVHATHSVDRDGRRQIDPRDDKYLHSHARKMRWLVKTLDARERAA